MRLAPLLSLGGSLAAWQAVVMLMHVPVYVLPGPVAIFAAYLADAAVLNRALLATLSVAAMALLCATVLGVALACLITASRLARAVLEPWTVVLQVTPIVAIAPLIIIWIGNPFTAMVVCATIVAFFPIYANTAEGLAATPQALRDVFALNGASAAQEIFYLRLPAAVPYFLTGLKISGGLALVGAVVAEFVTGAGGIASGLAFRILEAGYRLQIARMFAALVLLAMAGLVINAGFAGIARAAARRWGA